MFLVAANATELRRYRRESFMSDFRVRDRIMMRQQDHPATSRQDHDEKSKNEFHASNGSLALNAWQATSRFHCPSYVKLTHTS